MVISKCNKAARFSENVHKVIEDIEPEDYEFTSYIIPDDADSDISDLLNKHHLHNRCFLFYCSKCSGDAKSDNKAVYLPALLIDDCLVTHSRILNRLQIRQLISAFLDTSQLLVGQQSKK
jgi:hypothetical protein